MTLFSSDGDKIANTGLLMIKEYCTCTYHEISARIGDHCLTKENSKTRVSSVSSKQKAQTRCPREHKLKGELKLSSHPALVKAEPSYRH